MTTIHVTAENYEQQVHNAKKPVVIDFWAPWCGPCQMMGPVFEKLSDEMPEATFAKVNVDDEPLLAGSFGIQGIPALIIMKNGKESGRIVGFAPKEIIRQKIRAAL